MRLGDEINPMSLSLNYLPETVQRHLTSRGHGEQWFAQADRTLRLTVLNLYVKLRSVRLWRFVDREQSSTPGNLEFVATNVGALERALTQRRDFTNPIARDQRSTLVSQLLEVVRPGLRWEARERRARGALHIKSFTCRQPNEIQAHIDPVGSAVEPWRWALPLLPAAQLIRHC